MDVTVLCGGPSSERSVSLVSGNAVAAGLTDEGHRVRIADASPSDLSALDEPSDVIFPVFHGAFGESGELQEILESRDLNFVGSGSAASKLGIDKRETKSAWQAAGLPTPRWEVLDSTTSKRAADISVPCVVKAPSSGSSIDVYLCQTHGDVMNAVERVLQTNDSVIVESMVAGTELTIGFLEEKPLPAIRIVPSSGFYNFDAKYRDRTTGYFFDLNLSTDVMEKCYDIAWQAYKVVGCRDLGRIDLIVAADGTPNLLEINTMPGFTPTSLLPKAANHAGISFGRLVEGLVNRAYQRRKASPALRKAS